MVYWKSKRSFEEIYTYSRFFRLVRYFHKNRHVCCDTSHVCFLVYHHVIKFGRVRIWLECSRWFFGCRRFCFSCCARYERRCGGFWICRAICHCSERIGKSHFLLSRILTGDFAERNRKKMVGINMGFNAFTYFRIKIFIGVECGEKDVVYVKHDVLELYPPILIGAIVNAGRWKQIEAEVWHFV